MRRILLAVVFLALSATASAQQTYYCHNCGQQHYVQQPTVTQAVGTVATPAPVAPTYQVVASWGPQDYRMDVAYRSAMWRAKNGVGGHCSIEDNGRYKSGVGYAWNSNPNAVTSTPKTCFWGQRGQGCYVAVKAPNGYVYSTLVIK